MDIAFSCDRDRCGKEGRKIREATCTCDQLSLPLLLSFHSLHDRDVRAAKGEGQHKKKETQRSILSERKLTSEEGK